MKQIGVVFINSVPNGALKLPVYSLYADTTNWPKPLAWNICGVLAILWFLITFYRVTAHIVTNLKIEGAIYATKECTELEELKQRAANAFGLRRIKRIKIVASDVVNAPISYGFIKKTILLPRDYQSRYSEAELLPLLLHEMAHIKNGDTVKLYLLRLAGSILILPPGFIRDFKRDTEIYCDSRVMGAQSVERDAYAELMVRECSGKVTAMKGLAFSDSFRAIESRVNAIYEFTSQKHRFPAFAAGIMLVLLAMFAWRIAVPAGWFISNKPVDRSLDIYVAFSGEHYPTDLLARSRSYEETGVIPDTPPDRPGMTYFDGTYERLEDGSVRIDRVALHDAIEPLEKQGAAVEVIWFSFYNYSVFEDNKYVADYPIFANELESFDESERYMFVINHPSESYSLEERFYNFAAHWL
jgi:beta-lactamase regulating signal transducer with metallopeptidase domain